MKFKIGDKVRTTKDFDTDTKEGLVGKVVSFEKTSWGDVGVEFDERVTCGHDCRGTAKDGHGRWGQSNGLVPVNTKKIVITSDGVETLARLYDGNKVIKTATAKCSPADTFDFEVGASLAYDRLMKKTVPPTFSEGVKTVCEAIRKLSEATKNACKDTEAKQKWRIIKDRPVRVGDYIRLTYKDYPFDEVGDILKVDRTMGTLAQVYGRNHKRDTQCPNEAWSYALREYEIVEPVTYKAGDKVKVIRNTCYHSMQIGEVVTLEKPFLETSDTAWFVKEYNTRCYINESDFEPYTGEKVNAPKPEFEVGKQYRWAGNEFHKGGVLEITKKAEHAYDFKIISGFEDWRHDYSFAIGSALEKEIMPTEGYNGKVVCVKSAYPMYWTVGKVYEIKDGVVRANDGTKRFRITKENLQNIGDPRNEFIPIVE